MKKLLIFSAIALASACGGNSHKEAGVLPADSMVSVLYDIHITEASLPVLQIYGDSANRTAMQRYDAIFRKHNISFNQFDSSMNYYLRDPRKMQRIYQKVLDQLNSH